jgi:environmental stress-induced protein Ves
VSAVQKLDARSYKSMPWKNGGGTTTEIARSPGGDSLADFDWRISMAHVGGDGPFSIFDGIDRSIAILAGRGMTLGVGQRGEVRLDVSSPPFAFPADLALNATLAAGPIDDFNVMTRRGRWRHLLSRLTLDARAEVAPLGDLAFVFAVGGEAALADERLRAHDAVLLARGESVAAVPEPAGELLVADLWRI